MKEKIHLQASDLPVQQPMCAKLFGLAVGRVTVASIEGQLQARQRLQVTSCRCGKSDVSLVKGIVVKVHWTRETVVKIQDHHVVMGSQRIRLYSLYISGVNQLARTARVALEP